MLPTVVIQHRAVRGFWLGVVVSSAVWMLVVAVREESGTSRLEDGATGEELTATRFLRRLERRGWKAIHDIEFDRFNVDHVAVGPGGVLAVESKKTRGDWDISLDPPDPYLAQAIDQARSGSDKIRKLLRTDIGDVDVTPVLVCWGSGVVSVDGGHAWRGEVLVVVGRQASQAVAPLSRSHLDDFTIDCVVQALEAFVGQRERYERDHQR